jgi:RsmE family RNA methyltransferase
MAGTRLRAGLTRGALGSAEVVAVQDGAVTLRFEPGKEADPVPAVDLVLALPRPKVLSRVLQMAAAWGVRRIDLVNAWRVERSYFASPRLEPAALDRDLRLGCEQGGGTWLPEIAVHPLLVPFLESELRPRLAAPSPRYRIIAHPSASQELPQVVTDRGPWRAVVAVGPEGGFVDRELRSFEQLGFVPVGLGPRILRVEAATCAILAILALLARHRCEPGSRSASLEG